MARKAGIGKGSAHLADATEQHGLPSRIVDRGVGLGLFLANLRDNTEAFAQEPHYLAVDIVNLSAQVVECHALASGLTVWTGLCDEQYLSIIVGNTKRVGEEASLLPAFAAEGSAPALGRVRA